MDSGKYINTVSADYSSLWDGFEPVCGRITKQQKTLRDLCSYWLKRASIEESYAKSLMKLAKAPMGKGERGTMANCLDALRFECEQLGKLHLEVATTMKTSMQKDLEVFALDSRKNMQKTLNRGLTLTKDLAQSKVKEAKSKDAYYKYSQLALVNPEKYKSRSVAGEDDYRKRVERLKEAQLTHYSEMPTIILELQRVDEQTLDKMRDSWDAYVRVFEQNVPHLQDISSLLKESLDKFDKERDMKDFVDENYTGEEKPPIVTYVPFGSAESSPSYGNSSFGFAGSVSKDRDSGSSSFMSKTPMQISAPSASKKSTPSSPSMDASKKAAFKEKRKSRLSKIFNTPTEVLANSKELQNQKKYYDSNNFYDQQAAQYDDFASYKAEVVYEFVGENNEELNIHTGDVLEIYGEESGWLYATNSKGENGRVPASYVQAREG